MHKGPEAECLFASRGMRLSLPHCKCCFVSLVCFVLITFILSLTKALEEHLAKFRFDLCVYREKVIRLPIFWVALSNFKYFNLGQANREHANSQVLCV